MTESTTVKKFKINDRVKRSNASGSYGTVKEVRAETRNVTSHTEDKDRHIMVSVHWDSGTISYFSPSSLDLVKE